MIVAYPHQPRARIRRAAGTGSTSATSTAGRGSRPNSPVSRRASPANSAIPKERIFVAGLSAGGAMAEVLAATYPDRVRRRRNPLGAPLQSGQGRASAFAAMKGARSPRPPCASSMERAMPQDRVPRRRRRDGRSHQRERILEEARRGPRPLKAGRPRMRTSTAGASVARCCKTRRPAGRRALGRRGRRPRLVRRRQPRQLYPKRRTGRFARHGAVLFAGVTAGSARRRRARLSQIR